MQSQEQDLVTTTASPPIESTNIKFQDLFDLEEIRQQVSLPSLLILMAAQSLNPVISADFAETLSAKLKKV